MAVSLSTFCCKFQTENWGRMEDKIYAKCIDSVTNLLMLLKATSGNILTKHTGDMSVLNQLHCFQNKNEVLFLRIKGRWDWRLAFVSCMAALGSWERAPEGPWLLRPRCLLFTSEWTVHDTRFLGCFAFFVTLFLIFLPPELEPCPELKSVPQVPLLFPHHPL